MKIPIPGTENEQIPVPILPLQVPLHMHAPIKQFRVKGTETPGMNCVLCKAMSKQCL